MDRLFLLECSSEALLIVSVIGLVALAVMSSWWAFICLIPVAIAMSVISCYCEIKRVNG